MVDQTSSAKSESLMFNDIMEEISTTVRKELSEFIQVQPYRLFREELNNFFKRINDLIQEEKKNGSNISRMTNHSQLVQTTSLKNDNTTIANKKKGNIGEKYLLKKRFIFIAKNRIVLIGNHFSYLITLI